MILVAGGTGTLGSRVVSRLAGDGTPVRVLTRRVERATAAMGDHVDVCVGDVRDPASLAIAMRDATVVVSAVQGFAGVEPMGAQTVDVDGNANLVRVAKTAGVSRFVLISAAGAAPDDAFSLRRVKYAAEQMLIGSGLAWCVIRPTVYFETWLSVLAEMANKKRAVTLFGRGENPINFVSADDVAALVQRAVAGGLDGRVWEIGGPADLTLNVVAERVLEARSLPPRIHHVPLPVLRTVAVLLRRIKPVVATLAEFGIAMDTTDMTLPHDSARAAFPDLPSTTLDALVAHRGSSGEAHEVGDGGVH